jgi:hypothetical protein
MEIELSLLHAGQEFSPLILYLRQGVAFFVVSFMGLGFELWVSCLQSSHCMA